jgi:hypothetical protein
MRIAQKASIVKHKVKEIVIAPKEENYLLNEIIEHILNTKHKTRVEWERIRNMPYKSARGYSRDYTSAKVNKNELDQAEDINKFKR